MNVYGYDTTFLFIICLAWLALSWLVPWILRIAVLAYMGLRIAHKKPNIYKHIPK